MILDGKKIKNEILSELKNEVSLLEDKPKLVVIQVGSDEASNVYIKQKEKMCNYVGYDYSHVKLDDGTTTEELVCVIDKFNKDNLVSGILVQMPLPKHIDSLTIQNAVLPEKDVDGLSDINSGMLMHGKNTLYPCTPYGIMELLNRYNISLEGKNVCIVGRSNLVGKPLALLMINASASVMVCNSKTMELAKYTKNADILVVATGKKHLINGDMVKNGATVIDVGITKENGQLYGDVCFDDVFSKVSYITPVPGGVGPMTVAMLAKNILKAYKIQQGDK